MQRLAMILVLSGSCIGLLGAVIGMASSFTRKEPRQMSAAPQMPAALIEAIENTPKDDNDKWALANSMIPPSAWKAYVGTLETNGNPPRQIGPNAWEVTLKNGTTWTAFGETAVADMLGRAEKP